MHLALFILNVLLAQSEVPGPSPPKDSDQIILQIIKTGGIGGVHQECLLFRDGRMVVPGGTTLRLDPKETQRLLALARRLPPRPKRRQSRAGGASHDYPLSYWVRIFEAGKEIESCFPVETKDPAINEFVTAIVSHERSNKPQLKGP